MAEKKSTAPKIVDFGMTPAFVVVRDDNQVEVVALKPSDEQIVELTKYWLTKRDEEQNSK